MLSLLSKFHSVVPCVRGFEYRLYSSADKPSRFPNLTKLAYSKKKEGKATKEKTKPKSVAKKTTKNPSNNSLKRSVCQNVCGESGDGSKKGSGSKGSDKNPPPKPQQPTGVSMDDKCDMIHIRKANSRPFRRISYCLLTLIAGLTGYYFTHVEEKEHHFVPYEYMYKRLKRFSWRDGRTTLFHGPNNFIKDEEHYEKKPDQWVENDLERRKKLRDQHAKEELERRRIRHEKERKLKNGKENAKDVKTDNQPEGVEQVKPEVEDSKTEN